MIINIGFLEPWTDNDTKKSLDSTIKSFLFLGELGERFSCCLCSCNNCHHCFSTGVLSRNCIMQSKFSNKLHRRTNELKMNVNFRQAYNNLFPNCMVNNGTMFRKNLHPYGSNVVRAIRHGHKILWTLGSISFFIFRPFPQLIIQTS